MPSHVDKKRHPKWLFVIFFQTKVLHYNKCWWQFFFLKFQACTCLLLNCLCFSRMHSFLELQMENGVSSWQHKLKMQSLSFYIAMVWMQHIGSNTSSYLFSLLFWIWHFMLSVCRQWWLIIMNHMSIELTRCEILHERQWKVLDILCIVELY